ETGLARELRGYTTDMARVVLVATTPTERETLADHVDPADEVFVVAPAVEQSRSGLARERRG
ncbi:MAG TPA: hypothetical protein VFT35_07135, partial [Gaiellaceae bacterium]|nr:hypothetical protein [Gaiellaceae bacterium]